MVTYTQAKREAELRYGQGSSRFWSFMASWEGLLKKNGNSKAKRRFGRGRRTRHLSPQGAGVAAW